MKANIAAAHLMADGKALSKQFAGRLLSLTLTESREENADKLEFTLSNHDGALAPLRQGAVLTLKLGWQQGDEVTPGLIDKGRFTVDEVEKSGPPDVVTVRARSANLTGALRRRRDAAHRDTTLGAVVTRVARANGLTAKVHASLAAKPIAWAEQAGKSDMAFIRDLGRRHDAAATVKDGNLIFSPIGKGESAGGKALPAITLTKREGWTWRFTSAKRGDYDGAEAQWHDRQGARRRTAQTGGSSNPRRLRRVYATEQEAQAAAEAERGRQARGTHGFDYELALGDPAMAPERPVTLKGWDSEIDGVKWIVKEATHTFGPDGLKTRLVLESRG